jgi:hypothetical protein
MMMMISVWTHNLLSVLPRPLHRCLSLLLPLSINPIEAASLVKSPGL